MSNDRRDETTSRESGNETSKGAQKLQLSITRMKKLRSAVKGGPENAPVSENTMNNASIASMGWVLFGVSVRQKR